MDLSLFARVVWRFRLLVLVGLLLAVVAALGSVVTIRSSHGSASVGLRSKRSYESQISLLVTQPGFPWGSAMQVYAKRVNQPVPVGDPTRLIEATNVYIALANSNDIRNKLRTLGTAGRVTAAPSYASLPASFQGANLPAQLPVMAITVSADSSRAATNTANLWLRTFRRYIERQQEDAKITPALRLQLQTLTGPTAPAELGKPKITLAVVAFLAVMIVTIGFALVLENVRPRPMLRQAPPATSLHPSRNAA